ncbi:MAG: T9SS type A sorting domain-containing protein [Reichenbachiella sp.]
MKNYTLIIVLILVSTFLQAQKIDIEPTITPDFFQADEEITIQYNVTGTSMSTWDDAWLWLWTPDNDNASVTSNVNPASDDTALSDAAKFTKTEDNGQHFFTIKITLTDFTNLSKNEINQVGMLIKGNDWADGQSVDYTTATTNELTIRFDNPTGTIEYYESGAEISIELTVSETSNIVLKVDDIELTTKEDATTLTFIHPIIEDGEFHVITAIATTESSSAENQFSYSLIPDDVPTPDGLHDGINYHDDGSVTLVLMAPNKNNVVVIGDFNDWEVDADFAMNRDGERFWVTINGLNPNELNRFQYLIDGEIRIADPYSEKIGSPYDDPEIIEEGRYPGLEEFPYDDTQHAVSYLKLDQTPYEWEVTDFVRPDVEDLVIYELLIRDFTDERSYQAAINKLDYLQDLGVNALELMPITEFEGNISWGYNPSFKMATDKYYGTENELKLLIDEAHKRGMAVIFDMVLNHTFGRGPLARIDNDDAYGAPTNNNVWLNRTAKHPFNVGYDYNHESQYTKDYIDQVNAYWLTEYNIDGYRFDLSKGFTQKNTGNDVGAWNRYDASRVALLKRMADEIWNVDSDSYIIFEHLSENQEETELANYGIMLWTNMTHDYKELGRGYSQDLDWIYHESRGWNDPHLVGYIESHDEERLMVDLLASGTRSLAYSLVRSQLNAAFFFPIPGPKMIWQFGEMGYDEPLNRNDNGDHLKIKPTHWEYLEDENRKKLVDVYTALSNLKTKTGYIDSEYFSWRTNGDIKWINIDHPEVQICVVGNFTNVTKTGNAHLLGNGTWYNYLTEEPMEVSDYENLELQFSAGQFYVFTSELIENYIENDPFILTTEEKLSEPQVSIYPNPVNDMLNINAPTQIQSIKVFDLSGHEILNQSNIENSASIELNLRSLNKGIYIINILTHDNFVSQRFVKE